MNSVTMTPIPLTRFVNEIDRTRAELSAANRRLQDVLAHAGDFAAEAEAFAEQDRAFRAYQAARAKALLSTPGSDGYERTVVRR